MNPSIEDYKSALASTEQSIQHYFEMLQYARNRISLFTRIKEDNLKAIEQLQKENKQ